MTRINDIRPQYQPPPKADKPGRGLKRTRLKPVADDTAKDKRRYDKMLELYFADNPNCAGCDCEPERLAFHHICRGGNRKRSRTNPNTGMGGCDECHELWDAMPKEEQVAVKCVSILRAVNRYLAPAGHPNPPQAVELKQVIEHMKAYL
jgi:hypothetical protein